MAQWDHKDHSLVQIWFQGHFLQWFSGYLGRAEFSRIADSGSHLICRLSPWLMSRWFLPSWFQEEQATIFEMCSMSSSWVSPLTNDLTCFTVWLRHEPALSHCTFNASASYEFSAGLIAVGTSFLGFYIQRFFIINFWAPPRRIPIDREYNHFTYKIVHSWNQEGDCIFAFWKPFTRGR